MVIETGRLTAPIDSTATADVVMSADGSKLYAAGQDGKVRVYDVASRALLSTLNVGVELGGIDIAPDGSFLLVAERKANGAWGDDDVFRSSSVVYKVDLSSGAVTTFSLGVTGHNYTFFDVALLADGSALVSQTAYSAWLPLWHLDLESGNFTASQSTYTVRGRLTRSQDATHVLFTPSDISSAPIHLWESGLGFTASGDGGFNEVTGYNAGVQAISLETGLIVQFTSWGAYRYDLDLHLIGPLPVSGALNSNVSAALFDPTGAYLYLLSDNDDLIYQLSTSDWSVVRTYAVGSDVGDGWLGGYGNRLQMTPDGRYFTVMTASGLRLVENDGLANDFVGTAGVDLLDGGAGDDELDGASGNDTLAGGSGDDVLDGGTGADRMRGGTGDDLYQVDDSGDVVEENAGEGADEVRTSLSSYSLFGTNVEDLTASTNAAHDFRGSAGNNVVTGAEGNDLLRLQDGGDDIGSGGGGNDVLYFGSAFTAADKADGGADRDVLILQGHYALTLGATNIAAIESISLQSGARTTWGDTANNFYDYNITMNDLNVGGGEQLIVNGQSLRAGEDFAFDGSAETGDGKYLVYGGHGVDTFTGGAGNDVFFFEGARFGPDDTVDGGAGRDAIVISSGSGINRFEFGDASLTSIESISLNNRFTSDPSQKPSYELVLGSGNVAPGATLIVNGSSLSNRSQSVSVDGSAVEGNLILLGGFGDDVLTGGDGSDRLQGGEGIDRLTGGGGADTFRYAGHYDSTSQLPDRILDFVSGTDRIDLSAIDADVFAAGNQAFRWIGSNAFAGTGAASAGELRAYQFGNDWFVEGDMDGNGAADLVIVLITPVAAPVQGDFVL